MVKPATQLRRGTALVKLADLLSTEGWKSLCSELALQGDETNRDHVRKKPEVLVPKISHTLLLARVMDDRGPAISMLNEILGFLTAHGMAARTTGTIATLPGLEKINYQQRQMLSDWDEASLQRLGRNIKLADMWEEASLALDRLLLEASEEHPGAWRPIRGSVFLKQRPSVTRYREDVVDLLRRQIALIRGSLPPLKSDDFVVRILDKCQAIKASLDELVDLHQAGYEFGGLLSGLTDKIAIFAEQIRITATLLARQEGMTSLIELSIFRNLPQLFEVWLLCFILRSIEKVGYNVIVENVGKVGKSDTWNLKYAAAKTPVARIGSDKWVFFQLKANATSTMPDIAIYDNNTASGHALIVLDAKLSEKGGYAAADYRATLDKYRSLSPLRITVEYMDRPDIAAADGMMFGVRPNAPGVEKLRLALFSAIVPVTRPAIAVIDCSQSFDSQLPQALAQMLTWADAGLLKDEFILFAGRAERRTGLANAIRKMSISLPGSGGTLVASLKEELLALREKGNLLEIVLFSDAEFQDGDLEVLRTVTDRLWQFDLK